MCSLSIPRDFKSPYFVLPNVFFIVLPSDSEASFTSFGTALRDVILRHVSAEGPIGFRLGMA